MKSDIMAGDCPVTRLSRSFVVVARKRARTRTDTLIPSMILESVDLLSPTDSLEFAGCTRGYTFLASHSRSGCSG